VGKSNWPADYPIATVDSTATTIVSVFLGQARLHPTWLIRWLPAEPTIAGIHRKKGGIVNIEVRPLSSALGAEVLGADLSHPDDDEQFSLIHTALLDRNVVVVRDQKISPADHIAFSRRFGTLEHHVLQQFLLPGHPEILQLSNKHVNGNPLGLQDAGREWHTDLSYMQIPSLGSLLLALEIPPTGGDTLFGNLHAAYDTLPPETQTRVAGLMVRHSYEDFLVRSKQESAGPRPTLTAEQRAKAPAAMHPLVRTHPETGRKVLYVSPSLMTGIQGMDDAEGRSLLNELIDHATQPAFVYRHQWRVDDLVFWDNRSTIHLATPFDPSYTRHMHRTTVRGDRVV